MQQLSKDEVRGMTLEEKISRMDDILEEIHKYRFPYSPENFPFFHMQSIANTEIFRKHSQQTKLLWMCFEFLLQGEYLSTYYGMMNLYVYNDMFNPNGWLSLRTQLNYNALTQAVITGSRIQFEQLMKFIYFALENKEIEEEKGSKFARFKNWIIEKGCMDDLFYLMPFLVACRKHDDLFRNAEVHKGSKLKSDLFSLRAPDVNVNEIMALNNYLLGFMENFLSVMDNQRPSGMKHNPIPDFELDFIDWTQAYFDRDEAKLKMYMQTFNDNLK